MSKMKEWLLDRQENGDDGTGFNDYNEGEPEIKCNICGNLLDEDDIVWADIDGQIVKDGNDTAWCVSCLPSEGDSNE